MDSKLASAKAKVAPASTVRVVSAAAGQGLSPYTKIHSAPAAAPRTSMLIMAAARTQGKAKSNRYV